LEKNTEKTQETVRGEQGSGKGKRQSRGKRKEGAKTLNKRQSVWWGGSGGKPAVADSTMGCISELGRPILREKVSKKNDGEEIETGIE